MQRWENWSGSVRATPAEIEEPNAEQTFIERVRHALGRGDTVRVAGTGHSFVPLCETDGTLVLLDRLQGLIEVDVGRGEATLHAGTKLSSVGPALLEHGLAMRNLGDIDKQSLAGAVSTGTHGTGHHLGNIATQVTGLRLITGTGELLDCSETVEPEMFKLARVSLGALGVMVRITLELLPAYRLHERSWTSPFEACVADIETFIASNRHFEFFWVPEQDACAIKTLNPTGLVEAPADAPAADISGWAASYVRPERVNWSHKIFPSVRDRKFNEEEFAVPAEAGIECMREIRALMRSRYRHVQWPIEYRTLRADNIGLSPAYGRPSVTISLHQGAGEPYQAFFADAEAIFKNHRGRPHWGKVHTHTSRELEALYPQWDEFLTLRARLDPKRRFQNAYLRTLLGA